MTADAEAPTLTEFLLAQIEVDEAAANVDPRRNSLGGWMVSSGGEDAARMMNLFRPPRVLAECTVKRAIVELHGNHGDMCRKCMHQTPYLEMTADAYPCGTLRALASVYADREGYREEWR